MNFIEWLTMIVILMAIGFGIYFLIVKRKPIGRTIRYYYIKARRRIRSKKKTSPYFRQLIDKTAPLRRELKPLMRFARPALIAAVVIVAILGVSAVAVSVTTPAKLLTWVMYLGGVLVLLVAALGAALYYGIVVVKSKPLPGQRRDPAARQTQTPARAKRNWYLWLSAAGGLLLLALFSKPAIIWLTSKGGWYYLAGALLIVPLIIHAYQKKWFTAEMAKNVGQPLIWSAVALLISGAFIQFVGTRLEVNPWKIIWHNNSFWWLLGGMVAAAFFLGRSKGGLRWTIVATMLMLILIALTPVWRSVDKRIAMSITPVERNWQIYWTDGAFNAPVSHELVIMEYSTNRIEMVMSYTDPQGRYAQTEFVWDRGIDPFWGEWKQDNPPGEGLWRVWMIHPERFEGQMTKSLSPDDGRKKIVLVSQGLKPR